MRALIVDDEKRLGEALAEYLAPEGIEVRTALDGLAGKRLLEEEPFDVLVTDLRMPGLDGLDLLKWAREEGPALPVVVMSAHGEIRDAVSALRLGACDYLVKPFDPDELVMRLHKAVGERRSRDRLEAGRRSYGDGVALVGESQAIQEVLRLIDKAGPASSTVLITGESGTGKEVAARLIHERSGREGPFVAVNLGALPENLVESELFGYEKGAFTGADARKVGLFETAHGGTLFLDEIGELALHLQVKILRAIQERKVQRLGALKGVPVDARLVAATNRDLEAAVRAGSFREDLYYRINVIRIRMPPLRERAGDVPLLAGYFLGKIAAELGRRFDGFSPEALALLERHSFPGNVRELENAIERSLILSEGSVVAARDLQFFAPLPAAGGGGGGARSAPDPLKGGEPMSLAELEHRAIAAALSRNSYHRERTAAELGISRRTLLNKIKEYGLRLPGDPED
ncbi:MAG TPA: sigma-54 dependent transcriptional regulator [Rectinemataceae bacterium]|nr:sigma-54 dependent transcriptional regulator [Rectinemataceae bacterium]